MDQPVSPASLLRPQQASRGSDQRISCLDTARGLSIILVVIFHASITLNHLGALNPQVWLISDFFASIRMPVFFAISGFLGARLLLRDWPHVLKRRVLLLAYLYALWSGVDLLVNAPLDRPTGVKLWLESLAWPNPVLWFIWALSMYFVLAKICREMRWPALLAAVCLAIALQLKSPASLAAEHLKAMTYASCFLAGAYLGQAVVLVIKFWKVALAASFSFYVVVFFAERWSYISQDFEVLLPGAGIIAGLSGARLLDSIPFVNTALSYLGRNTLTIYLAHTQFLKLIGPVFGDMTDWPGFQNWGIIVTVPAVIALSVALRPLSEAIRCGWLYAFPLLPRAQPGLVTAANQADTSAGRAGGTG